MSERSTQNLKGQILSVAQRLLSDEGYQNFSLRRVAREVGVSATSIYLHFEGKDDLIHTLIEKSIDHLNTRLEEASGQCSEPIRKLEALAHEYVKFALRYPGEYQIIYSVNSDKMSRYPKEKFRKARKGYDLVTRAIEKGVEKGLMDETQPRVAAYTFWAQLHGIMAVVLSQRLDTRIDRDEFIQQAIDHILYGFHIRTAARAAGKLELD